MTERIIIKRKDEVYHKLDCDPGISMEISDHFCFMAPNYKFHPKYKAKVWDGKLRLYSSMNALLYCGLTEELQQFCTSRNYELEFEDVPGDAEFSVIEAKEFIAKLNLPHEVRDYQLDAFIHAVRKRRCILISPTGSGKSLICYLLTCWYKQFTDKKILVVVPTTSLVSQMTSDFESYGLPTGLVHKIMSGAEKQTKLPIVISTWQSAHRQDAKWFSQFECVIGDEAHLFSAKSLTSIMKNLPACKYKIGMTGTLDDVKSNGMTLTGLFGPVYRVTSSAELMSKKVLAELVIKCILLKHPEADRKLIAGGDYQTEIDFIVTSERRNRFITNLALSLNNNTLILFQYVEKHGKVLFDMIKEKAGNRKVYFISGSVDGEAREEIRKILETETDSILVASSGTSSTGINIKNLHNIIFSSPSKSRVRNLQSIGRSLRTTEDKTSATLYDIADDLSYKSKKNHTILHLMERIKIYISENFKYKIYNVDL